MYKKNKDMFYKKEGTKWFKARRLDTPNGRIDMNNKENNQGWEWHDTPPKEYLEWQKEQEDDRSE